MSENSVFKASNVKKINKEFLDLKSRKVLTDLLNSQIDQNEHMSSENAILIINQRKLLNLLQSKDRVIEEIKQGTFYSEDSDYNQSGHNSRQEGESTSIKNRASVMADYEWQIIMARLERGGLLLRLLFEKKDIQQKFQCFAKIQMFYHLSVKASQMTQITQKIQQNVHLKSHSLFKTIESLLYHSYKFAFCLILLKSKSSAQSDSHKQSVITLIAKMNAETQLNHPLALNKDFYDRLALNQSKKKVTLFRLNKAPIFKKKWIESCSPFFSDNNKQQKKEMEGGIIKLIKKVKEFNKAKQCSYRLKALLICQKGRLFEQIRKGGMSQEQVKDFLKKTHVMIHTIQNDFNQKCKDIQILEKDRETIERTHKEQIQHLSLQLKEVQKEENKKDIVERIQFFEKQLVERDEDIRQLNFQFNNTQKLYEEKCGEHENLQDNQIKEDERTEQIIDSLKQQLLHNETVSLEHQQIASYMLQLELNYKDQCIEITSISSQKANEQKTYEEIIQTLQREVVELKEREEQRNNSLKRDVNISKQLQKELELERQDKTYQVESINSRIQQLQNDKNGLLNNFEMTVIRLQDVQLQLDNQNVNLTQTNQEKHLLFIELEQKEHLINQLYQKITEVDKKLVESDKKLADADKKIISENMKRNITPNAKQEKEDLLKKLQKSKKEKDELQLNYDELYQNHQKIRKLNTELTKEAISLNSEKLQTTETVDNLSKEIEQRDHFKQTMENKIQTLLGKLEEKETQLKKQSIKPELLQKLVQDKIELDEENQSLKKELMRIHQVLENQDRQSHRLQSDLQASRQKEQENENDIQQNNTNLATLTREKINLLKDMSLLHHDFNVLKEENTQLKESILQYQRQIEDYQNQLELYAKVFKVMDQKISNSENKQNSTFSQINTQSNTSSTHHSSSKLHNQLENSDNDDDQHLMQRINHMQSQYATQNE